MNHVNQSILEELAAYETKLSGIRDGFKHSREGIWIAEGDDATLLQYVRELIDLFDCVLGKPNLYSQQISAYYDHGLRNMHGSPSLQSVRQIVALVKAAQTKLSRQPQHFQVNRDSGTRIAIGHGRSKEWKDLKDFIQDRLRLPWDEFNRLPVAGVSTSDRLQSMLEEAAFAFLVLTAEDEQVDGTMHARLNVAHEVGLFQARLGFSRAIVLLEDTCEEFSNIAGLGQIRFPKSNIRASFHDVQLVLEREGLIVAQDNKCPQ